MMSSIIHLVSWPVQTASLVGSLQLFMSSERQKDSNEISDQYLLESRAHQVQGGNYGDGVIVG